MFEYHGKDGFLGISAAACISDAERNIIEGCILLVEVAENPKWTAYREFERDFFGRWKECGIEYIHKNNY